MHADVSMKVILEILDHKQNLIKILLRGHCGRVLVASDTHQLVFQKANFLEK